MIRNKCKLLAVIILLQLFEINDAYECDSIDVRNNVGRFKRLEKCTVIKGDLAIVLIEFSMEKDFRNVTFPELREITGFLLVYRVFGLKSIGSLFPNLVVIRGHNLLANYALIIYGNNDLQEIGLKSLISIQRGSVRIEDCPILCYSSTIDWTRITGGDTNYIAKSETIQCPTTNSCRGCEPENCWSNKACQRSDNGINFTGLKCHQECLGGCLDKTAKTCKVCRNAEDAGVCVNRCSEPKVLHANTFRCITKEKCFHKGWIVFSGNCVKHCPNSYRLENELDKTYNISANPVCILCEGSCPIFCEGKEIAYLSDTEKFRGCTIVNGSLQIRFTQDIFNIMEELEKNLGDIEEIRGYLKIYRSLTLSSLNFLRSLHTVHGKTLEMNRYSLIVYENNNLQTLWDLRVKTKIELKNGNLLFTANSKLCMHEIQMLQSIVTYNKSCNSTCDSVVPLTNGYKHTCNLEALFSESNVTSHDNVTIMWTPFTVNTTANETVLGYTIYYMEAPQKNITPYTGQDSCSSFSWRSEFVTPESCKLIKGHLTYEIGNLAQYTQYAFYIRTSIIQEDLMNGRNGQSEVHYFKTLADRPSQPMEVFTTGITNDSISIGWTLLPEEKDSVDHFTVDVFVQQNLTSYFDQRNYCVYPLSGDPVYKNGGVSNSEECCDADDNSYEMEDIVFQLHSSDMQMNCKEQECEGIEYKVKRSTPVETKVFNTCAMVKDKSDKFYDAIHHLKWNLPYQNATRYNPMRHKRNIEQYKYYVGSYIIKSANNFTISHLFPFTTYIFQLFAWGFSNLSSSYYLHHEQTLALLSADNIQLKILDPHNDVGIVHLMFMPPKRPNGVLLAYTIEYKMLNNIFLNGNTMNNNIIKCVSRKVHEQNKYVYVLRDLVTGLYQVRVSSITLVGSGRFTDWQLFRISMKEPDNKLRNGLITFGVLVLFSISLVGGYFCFKKFYRKNTHDDGIALIDYS